MHACVECTCLYSMIEPIVHKTAHNSYVIIQSTRACIEFYTSMYRMHTPVFYHRARTCALYIGCAWTSTHPSAYTEIYPSIPNIYPSIPNIYPSILNIYPSISNIYPSISNIYPPISKIYPSISNIYPSISNIYPSISNIAVHEYRMAQFHKMPDLYRSFSAKGPYNSRLFCRKRSAT